MFSQPNDARLELWFQRLNAQLKRLPIEERTRIHEEVRQHLDEMRAANEELGSSPEEAWELALTQFGDPGKFGQQMQRDMLSLPCDPNLWDNNPIIAASTYAFIQSSGSLMVAITLVLMANGLLLLISPGLPVGDPWSLGLRYSFIVSIGAVPIWTGWKTSQALNREGLFGTMYGLLGVAGPAAVVGLCNHDLKFTAMALVWLGSGCFAWWVSSQLKGKQNGNGQITRVW